MNFFFQPRGIAVIGATSNPFKSGNMIVRNLMLSHTEGIYPVNPNYESIDGIGCYPSVQAIPEPPDLAIIFVPAHRVVDAVKDCAATGVKGVMIQSGGFAETGEQGRSIERRILEAAHRSGMRIWGPNCMGLIDAVNRFVFSFMYTETIRNSLLVDKLSLIVQSGLLSAGFLSDIMNHHISGVSKVCSIGNKLDVNECDVLPILLDDPNTNVVGLYLESILDGRRFIDICRSSEKPIVVLKGGKSSKGAQAAMSHTASLAGNHRVLEGVLRQAGVIESNDFTHMIDICRSLSYHPVRPAGAGRVAIITYSGAAGILSTDFLDSFGMDLADLSQQTIERLAALFPDWMPVNNPIDAWPAMEKHLGSDINVIGEGVDALVADPNVDAIIVTTFAVPYDGWFNAERAGAASRSSGKPIFVWALGLPADMLTFKEDCRRNGIPVFQELHRMVECLVRVFGDRIKPAARNSSPSPRYTLSPLPVTASSSERGVLDEYHSKRILRDAGIPTVDERTVSSIRECSEAARLGYPLVMKGLLPGTIHKTETGLIHLGIRNRAALERSYRELKKRMDGRGTIVVQKQVAGSIELILGLIRDPQFGPCVMFGLGGVFAEAFKDTAFAMAPLSREDALELIGRIRGQSILEGFRGAPAVDRDELARILVALGNLGLAHPEIREIDINPMLFGSTGMTAVDATIVLDDPHPTADHA